MKESKTQSVRNIPPFGLRMQPDLKEKLGDIAKAKDISLNELITSTLSDVYRPEDASSVIVLNLPKYLSTALEVVTDYGNRPIEYAILEILREAFPNASGIQAVHEAEDTVINALDELERSLPEKKAIALSSALLELMELYGRNFKTSQLPADDTQSVPPGKRVVQAENRKMLIPDKPPTPDEDT